VATPPSLSRYNALSALSVTSLSPLSALVKCVAVRRSSIDGYCSCYHFGGADVVDLPDALLPEGQDMDMFKDMSCSDSAESDCSAGDRCPTLKVCLFANQGLVEVP